MIERLFNSLIEHPELAQAAVSLLLSGLLVGLYYKQYKISERQQELMIFEQEPTLEIEKMSLIENKSIIQVIISNYGGGVATEMSLIFEIYDLQGNGPKRTVKGKLRRLDDTKSIQVTSSQSSSIRPHELDAKFGVDNKTVLRSGNENREFKSLLKVAVEELRSETVIYAKPSIEFTTMFKERHTYTADFSIKLTNEVSIEMQIAEFYPWIEDDEKSHNNFTEVDLKG